MLSYPEFVQAAQALMNPYRVTSGTEYMAPWLYSLIRMTRPQTVLEFGSGYTTLFMLQALAENEQVIEKEKAQLREKTLLLGDLNALDLTGQQTRPSLDQWAQAPGWACNADPRFYLRPYQPHLISFERLPPADAYIREVETAVEKIGLRHLFTYVAAPDFSRAAIPADRQPVDLIFNDSHHYREVFRTFWPALNPERGMFIFHNVPAVKRWWDAIEWMKQERVAENDLEVLILEEPHKYNQNGCAVLRKTTAYKPSYESADPYQMFGGLLKFMQQ
jgi:predicted O-methyltransferase YrrM